ncbi:restriction endonuclease [Elizabethkingia anophelis]|jgi:hypothetical protein|uniref:restriction endonuclease n=1 Tax=Elizabethkingia anophelis TaxID=1117645 RepID=UPI0021A80C89|nr:restriction endonuclease [Elizabethkingia anophelis]MDV4069964.1 ATPase [Elizabethkingia anophelis]
MQNGIGKRYIIKASGERVAFDENKLKRSLSRAGATPEQVDIVMGKIRLVNIDELTTSTIYKVAFKWLKKISKPSSARYSLKRAIMALGPTGYPFEKLTAEILNTMGYTTRTGIMVMGYCVKHEIDVIATKHERHIMVECKFHNKQGYVNDVKIPLYIRSRFMDVERKWQESGCHGPQFHESWIATNGRFSDDAIQYGTCIGMSLIGWDYPKGKAIKDLVDSSGLYPVTCLISLNEREKRFLLDNEIVVCKSLFQREELLTKLGMSAAKIKAVIDECRILCEEV